MSQTVKPVSTPIVMAATNVNPEMTRTFVRHKQELREMLMHEELARNRMREDQERAAQERMVRALVVARRWERLASWASRRARHARRGLI